MKNIIIALLLLSEELLLRHVNCLAGICFGPLELDLPVRYMHIQLHENYQNLTTSVGSLDLKVESSNCRLTSDVIDRENGMYIVRVRLQSICKWFRIHVSHQGTAICNSPIHLQKETGDFYPEHCDCPVPLDKWIRDAACEEESELKEALSVFPSIDFAKVLDRGRLLWGDEKHRKSFSVCHYQIIDNQIYRECFGEYDGFKTFFDDALQSVLNKMRIPNTEFLFNLGDYPLSSRFDDSDMIVPLVSWCGSSNTYDIVLPTYEYADLIINEMTGKGVDIHTVGVPSPAWEEKSDVPIFRGRDSNKLRLSLAALSDKEPHLLDAGITGYHFHDETLHSPARQRMVFNDFFKHKYIISIDGTVAAYRLPLLLAGNSIILKSDSNYYEHFYSKLVPFEHVIPFNETTVRSQIENLSTLDHYKMLQSARQFTLDHLQPINFYCYYAQFFKKYSMKLTEPPRLPGPGSEKSNARRRLACPCHTEYGQQVHDEF